MTGRGRRLLGGTCSRRGPRDDNVEIEAGEFARQTREALDFPVRRSVLYKDVLTLHVAAFA